MSPLEERANQEIGKETIEKNYTNQSRFRRENGYANGESPLEHLDGSNEKGEKLSTGIVQVSVIEDKIENTLVFDYGTHEVRKGVFDYLGEHAFRNISNTAKLLKTQIFRHKILPKEEIPMLNMDYLFGSPDFYEGIDEQGNVTNNSELTIQDKYVCGSDPTPFKDLDRIEEEGKKQPNKKQFELYRSQIAEVRNTMHPRIKEYFDGYLNNMLFDQKDEISSEEILEKK